jgi:hypothetical protein
VASETTEPLLPEQAARLAEFARACRAAARVVVMYPETHPAIQNALQRVIEAALGLRSSANAVLTVTPDTMLLVGRATAKPEPAIGELAVVLRVYAPDPYRPRVRVILGADITRLTRPYDVNLWEVHRDSAGPKTVVSLVDPASIGIDALTFL